MGLVDLCEEGYSCFYWEAGREEGRKDGVERKKKYRRHLWGIEKKCHEFEDSVAKREEIRTNLQGMGTN